MMGVNIAAFLALCPVICGMVQPKSDVSESMLSNVHALAEKLSEMDQQNKEKLENHKREYIKNIQERRKVSAELATSNMQLQEQVKQQVKHNAELRTFATELKSDLYAELQDLISMRHNFSSALELISLQLNRQGDDSSALSVLQDLEHEDAARVARQDYESRLREVVHPVMSALQLSGPAEPNNLLKDLNENLKELDRDYAERDKALTAKYWQRVEDEEAKRKGLLAEQGSLRRSVEKLTNIEDRLTKAVSLLQAHTQKVRGLGGSLRNYAERLGIKAMPGTVVAQQPEQSEARKNPGQEESKAIQKAVEDLDKASHDVSPTDSLGHEVGHEVWPDVVVSVPRASLKEAQPQVFPAPHAADSSKRTAQPITASPAGHGKASTAVDRAAASAASRVAVEDHQLLPHVGLDQALKSLGVEESWALQHSLAHVGEPREEAQNVPFNENRQRIRAAYNEAAQASDADPSHQFDAVPIEIARDAASAPVASGSRAAVQVPLESHGNASKGTPMWLSKLLKVGHANNRAAAAAAMVQSPGTRAPGSSAMSIGQSFRQWFSR